MLSCWVSDTDTSYSTSTSSNCLPSTLLAVHLGFKFPLPAVNESDASSKLLTAASTPHSHFDQQLRQLHRQPGTLQSLSRLVIRRQLLQQLQNEKSALHTKYPPTEQSSTLARIVDEELCIPVSLKRYLSELSDVPNMRGYAPQHMQRLIRSVEIWE